MFDIDAFLDRAKAGAGVDSDYALAKLTGISKANISNYRLGKNLPDDLTIMKLCQLSGDDPGMVAIQVQFGRAANEETRSLWGGVADRLGKGLNTAILAVAVAMVFAAGFADQAQASEVSDSPVLQLTVLYIVSSILCRFAGAFLIRQFVRSRNYVTGRQRHPA